MTGGIMGNTHNTDNDYLVPVSLKHLMTGFREQITGENIAEVPEFTLTRSELRLLAKHWARAFIAIEFLDFRSPGFGAEESQIAGFANDRIHQIEALIGTS